MQIAASQWSGLNALRSASTSIKFASAGAQDIIDGALDWRLWYLMGSADMRRRYARSKLGQLWIMISSAIMISTIGFVWSYLWRQPIHEMLPFVAVGLIVWQLTLGILSEACTVLPENSRYFLNQYVPASTIIFSLLYRHGATFLLNMIFPIGLCVAFGVPISIHAVLAIPGLVLLVVTCFWIAFVLAILCARFRDVVQIVSSILQVAIFLTPVFWKPEFLSREAQGWLVYNPLGVLISIVRDPLIGRPVPASYWIAAVLFAFGGLLLVLSFIGRFRRRLIYWL